jgi:protein-S-isoprenylcysteine O-methyltransferase Ste14
MKHARIVSNASLVLLFLAFASANFMHWRKTGQPSGLGATLLEAWTAALFLARRPTDAVSRSWLAWLAAPIGSFAMLLARPSGGGLAHVLCEALQLGGVAIVLVSLSKLGRSFGLVAANRGVKTGGPYRVVRHPAYSGYLVTYAGYVAENPSPRNLALLAVGTLFQLVRIREEERVLRGDDSYRVYCERVTHRLVPYVY